MQANPLVEETRNQVAVNRGPLVYCLESDGISKNAAINNVILNTNSDFKTQLTQKDNRNFVSITAKGFLNANSWDKKLYQPLQDSKEAISLRLVPYFAWGNGSSKEMSVWFLH